MARVLLIDDDSEVLEINKKYLSNEGFEVYIADTPQKGIACAKKINPDCILLDVMMPGLNGYEVCRLIRSFCAAPILFLTGKGSEDDKMEGFTSGADDYIVKPYSLREVKARIDIHIRRTRKDSCSGNLLQFHNLTIDQLSHKAMYKGSDLMLANREYEVLLYLATHFGKEVTFEELGTALFGNYQKEDRRLVMVNVSRLRKKMAVDPELESMIETVWSKGYKFSSK